MKNWLASLLVFAMAIHCSSWLPAYAGEADDEEEIARKEKEAREKATKDAKAKAAAAATAAAEAKKGPPEKGPLGKPPSVVMPKSPLDSVCKNCLGTGTLPKIPYKPYLKITGGTQPESGSPEVWMACPDCKKFKDDGQVAGEFAQREQKNGGMTEYVSKQTGVPLQQLTTPYLSVQSNLPVENLQSIGEKLERLAGTLQTNSRSTVLLATHTNSDQLVLIDETAYGAFVDKVTKDKASADHYKKQARIAYTLTSGTDKINEMVVSASADPVAPVPADSAAVHMFGHMLMTAATNGKAKPWLVEGFAAYCENVTLGTNNMYSFQYEKGMAKLGKNWNMEVRNYANKNTLVSWERLFKIDPSKEKISAQEYLNWYAVVTCLIKVDPVRFDKAVTLIKGGDDSATALEKAYGRKITELQNLWGQWALVQK